jgi:BlaI family penicillinase repressor
MKNLPRISDAEWQVMETLWARSPLAATDVIEALASANNWKGNTVRTLLARLVRKGVLHVRKDGTRFLYRPAFDRARYVSTESRSFLDRVFFGSAKPLLLHFAENGRLSASDLEELKHLLEQKEK